MNLIDRLTDEYFHGIVRLWRTDQGLQFSRLTPAQVAYHEQIPAWGIRARCCAGVVLALATDSPVLDIRFTILTACRSYFGIDVEINGILSHGVRVEQGEGTYEGRLFELPDRRRRVVRVYLPNTLEIRLEGICLADGATIAPVPRSAYKLLCLGDSITQGMDARSPSSPYPVQLARLLGADLLNQGVGGHVFDAASLDAEVPFQPDLVTVAYGTNDWTRGTRVDQLRSNVHGFLARLREIYPPTRTRVAVLSPLWRTVMMDHLPPVDLAVFREAILATASQFEGVIPIDGLSLVPGQPWYFADGTHPNDAGFGHYVMNLYRVLRIAGAIRQ